MISLGSASLTTVCDDNLVLLGFVLFGNMPESVLRQTLKQHSISLNRLTPGCNLGLYNDDIDTVLFVLGAGGN